MVTFSLLCPLSGFTVGLCGNPVDKIQLACMAKNQFLRLGPGLHSMDNTSRKFALKVYKDVKIDTHTHTYVEN